MQSSVKGFEIAKAVFLKIQKIPSSQDKTRTKNNILALQCILYRRYYIELTDWSLKEPDYKRLNNVIIIGYKC